MNGITTWRLAFVFWALLFGAMSFGSDICPATKQKILILDLKSGWWGGDGGNFHQTVYNNLNTRCPGLIEFNFRHTPYGSFTPTLLTADEAQRGVLSPSGRRHKAFFALNAVAMPERADKLDETFNEYSQVWVLSGGEADTADMRVESDEFKKILNNINLSYKNIFIGTGFGNIYHANPILEVLGFKRPIETDRVTDMYPVPSAVTVKTWLEKGKDLADHPIFRNIDKLPEAMDVGGFAVASDWLDDKVSGLVVVGSSDGKARIAVNPTGAGMKLVVDTGIHRAYAAVSGVNETLDYLLNIVNYLQN